jgi:ketopantoate reductase
MRVPVIGAGALGGFFGAYLLRAEGDVTVAAYEAARRGKPSK